MIGLHTVFEHHDVMTPAALEAFVREYYTLPIGIDSPADGSIPATMRAYQLQGTPSIVLVDKQGRIRLSRFGGIDDMALGAAIGQLAAETMPTTLITRASGNTDADDADDERCDEDRCRSARG